MTKTGDAAAFETAGLDAHEADFIARCQSWSHALGAWALRAKAVQEDRKVLDTLITGHCGRLTTELVRRGMRLPDAERRAEKLMEEAFSR